MATTVDETTKLREAAPVPAPEPQRQPLSPKARRGLLIAAGAIVLAALIAWGVVVTGQRKEAFAARSLDQARSIAETGNLTEASAALQRIVQSFPGTAAAQEAVLTLNQVRLINNQNELAVVNLRDFLGQKHDPALVTAANALLGAAYENSQKPAEAAEAFKTAAAAAGTDFLKAEYLVNAGRAYRNAGKSAEAIAVYREVVQKYPKSTSMTEAQVRLAELTAGKL
ncbi:MAG: tetratricopeptide repeat protein [Gemmatimonadales bacterium]|nr:tetratricopeptide repeat protein [Gemmatimonadales bacterium]